MPSGAQALRLAVRKIGIIDQEGKKTRGKFYGQILSDGRELAFDRLIIRDPRERIIYVDQNPVRPNPPILPEEPPSGTDDTLQWPDDPNGLHGGDPFIGEKEEVSSTFTIDHHFTGLKQVPVKVKRHTIKVERSGRGSRKNNTGFGKKASKFDKQFTNSDGAPVKGLWRFRQKMTRETDRLGTGQKLFLPVDDITDGSVQKPWVFRYKDVRNWWLNSHYERRAAIELTSPTKWQPKSKPVWFTEVGCPAIHHGANQPNVFSDPKSTESKIPYFSNGSRDDLMQRNYLEALINYWKNPQLNPVSEVYNATMIDTDLISVWAWDARPFPDFPARKSVWSDGDNWNIGHWLTGRMGLMPISYIVEDLSRQTRLFNVDVTGLNGVLQGYHIDRPMSARAALTPLMEILNLELSEHSGHLVFQSPDHSPIHIFDDTDLELSLITPIQFTKADPDQALRDVRVHFIDASNDYQLGSVSARDRTAETVRISDLRLPLVMDQNYASFLAEQQLETHHLAMQSLSIQMSALSTLSFHVGDKMKFKDYAGVWRLDNLEIGDIASLSLTRVQDEARAQVFGNTPNVNAQPIFQGRPVCFAFDIPGPYNGPLIGVLMTPFETSEVIGPDETINANTELRLGALLTDLKAGHVGRWDRANRFELYMPNGRFSALGDLALLNGDNKFAVETKTGWEVLQIRDMELIGPDRYKCQTLLRGLDGSDADMMPRIRAGAV